MATRKPEPPVCPGPSLNPRKASFAIPLGATDCHAHAFDTRRQYGYADTIIQHFCAGATVAPESCRGPVVLEGTEYPY